MNKKPKTFIIHNVPGTVLTRILKYLTL